MKFAKLSYGKNHKKGISSIVGGIFFLVLMTAGFTVYYVALDSQSQMLDTQQIIADKEVAKIQEKFVVSASSDPGNNNRLSVQVINIGNNPIEVADIWIINKTDVNEPATRYDLDYRDSSIPVGYSGNVLTNTPLYLVPEIYDIKVVSSLGTIKTVEYDVNGGSNVLNAELLALPPDIRFGENATIALVVTNTGQFTVENVVPKLPLLVSPPYVTSFQEISTSPVDLPPSQTAVFLWDYTVNGPIGGKPTFLGNATGTLDGVPVQSNDATDTVTIRDFSTGGPGGEVILKEDLFTKPEIFMTIPSPFGDDTNNDALWAVNVVNPTPLTMNVTKVTISVMSPRANSNDDIFELTCTPVTVSPTPAGWSCPAENQLMWKANPPAIPVQRVDPYGVFPFKVKLEPGELSGAQDNLETIIVQTDVLTTLGEFGKTGYGTSMHNGDSSLVNVYLTTNPAAPTNPANIITSQTGIVADAAPKTFHAVLADFDNESTYKIKAGTRLIINVPKDWTNVQVTSAPGFTIPAGFPVTVNQQTQIVGILNSDIASGAQVLSFQATPPCVPNTQMFVMYILADGTVTKSDVDDFSLGPLNEAVLQVTQQC